MVITEGHLAIIIRTTRAGPATTLVINKLSSVQNTQGYVLGTVLTVQSVGRAYISRTGGEVRSL